LEEAALIRKELNEVEWKRMGKVQELFELMFDKPKEHMRRINDAYYYINGGYPSPNSDPRWKTAAKALGAMFFYMEAMGDPEVINNFLQKEFGLKLVVVEKRELKFKTANQANKAKIAKLAKELKIPLKDSTKPLDALRMLKDEAGAIQSVICQGSNKIKRTIYNQVKAVTDVRVGDFQKTVAVRVAKLKSNQRANGKTKSILRDTTNFVQLAMVAKDK
jgi:hypothetical protein